MFTQKDVFAIAGLGLACSTAGLVWLFGNPIPIIVAGVLVIAVSMLIDY